jgi:hypothetical protein
MNYEEAKAKAVAAAERKAKRAEKALELGHSKRKRRPKATTMSKLEKMRWKAFSLLIRFRDRNKGCITCTVGPVEDAGHMISRSKRATKYHPVNVNGQCKKCNWMDKFIPGYHDQAVKSFISRWGVGYYNILVELSRTTLKESRAEVIEATERYCRELEEMKKVAGAN